LKTRAVSSLISPHVLIPTDIFSFLYAFFANLINDQSGVTAIEYALIAALIAVAAISAFSLVGTSLSTTFSTIAGQL
jgi:pilus assembly protein Flp/PilA